MEWFGKDDKSVRFDKDGYICAYEGTWLTPTLARDIAKSLNEWANSQPIEAVIGKRYLTRDWEVVKYDGTQDVVARVYKKNTNGRDTMCGDSNGRVYYYNRDMLPSGMI